MSTETANEVIAVDAQPLVEHHVSLRPNGEMELMAAGTQGMAVCMDHLVDWAKKRLSGLKAEVADVEGELEIAIKNKWRTEGFRRVLNRLAKRITYYEKFKKLLELGFSPVPNFPGVQVFAMRTDKDSPRHKTYVVGKNWTPDTTQQPGKLPEGEGHYVDPVPICSVDRTYNKDGEHTGFKWTTQSWDDIEFPMAMARPVVMEAASRAMALKLFDEMGILPANPQARSSRRGDPLLVGRIVDPRSTQYNKKFVTFIIGWGIDTSTL